MAKHDADVKLSPSNKPLLFLSKRISEGGFILILTCALFILLALISYPTTPHGGWVAPDHPMIAHARGHVGAYLAYSLYFLFGYFSFIWPVGGIYFAWMVVKEKRILHKLNKTALYVRLAGFVFLLLGGCGLLSLKIHLSVPSAGGMIGFYIAKGWNYSLGDQGASLFFLALLLAGITWFTGLSWLHVTEQTGYYTLLLTRYSHRIFKRIFNYLCQKIIMLTKKKAVSPALPMEAQRKEHPLPSLLTPTPIPAPLPVIPARPKEAPVLIATPVVIPEKSKPIQSAKFKVSSSGELPSYDLLDKNSTIQQGEGVSHHDLELFSRDVEQHLLDFGIQADVVAVHPGPVITRFELQLAAGIKVSRLSSLAKDLARSLSVISVRIVEVIPGKTVVGLELPNAHRQTVKLSDVVATEVYQQAHSPLSLALGVDIAGHPMVVDLGKMPHLLVAGTTGSGKSVGINAMILSILFKSTPEQVRLIMVDPKMLELSVYDGIPHLLTPVVTDMKEAASALRWCVGEMERRYRLMAALGVRNLAGFNVKVVESAKTEKPLTDPLWKPTDDLGASAPLLETLPYIVVVIDELADMMMVVGKKVEQLIARIAQKARAAGIHLILATQRPSVDVLTGLIKSNIPTRMSFQVSSKIDSRTILDQQGAEQLLGHGDMLYLAPGTGAPLRVHGAFVDDQEVHRVADDWRLRGEPAYIDEITQIMESGEGGLNEEGEAVEEADPLYDQAVAFVIQTRKASISSVQRRLKIGYNRAARLIEEMERVGIVGPLDGGYRDVLVSTPIEK